MYADWFSEAVGGKAQTEAYLLPRMALTLAKPHHPEALTYSCHQLAARALAQLHDEDKLTSDHSIVMVGLGHTIYHTIITEKDKVVFDSLGEMQGNRYDPANEKYFSDKGYMMVKAVIPVDDFFRDYVEKIVTQIPSAASAATHPSP